MIIVRERKDGKWRSLSRADVEDVSEEVSLRGRLEGVFSWAKRRLGPGGRIDIEIEDKADLRVRMFKDAYVLSGSVRPSSASMFATKDAPKGFKDSMDDCFTWALGLVDEKPVKLKSAGSLFRMRRKDRRLAFAFLVQKAPRR